MGPTKIPKWDPCPLAFNELQSELLVMILFGLCGILIKGIVGSL